MHDPLGHNLHDPQAVSMLDFLHQTDAPLGFGDWLRKNFLSFDPAIRAWGQRGDPPSHTSDHDRRRSFHHHFLKCADDNCIHYIYGFLHPDELDQHCRAHTSQAKRDSGLSVGGTTPSSFLLDPTRGLLSSSGPSPSSPSRLLAPVSHQSGKLLQLPPLAQTPHKRDSSDSASTFSFFPDFPGLTRAYGSVDTEADPLLPPLKRNRVGPSQLESIEELMLLRQTDACLRCRVLKLEVCTFFHIVTVILFPPEMRVPPWS